MAQPLSAKSATQAHTSTFAPVFGCETVLCCPPRAASRIAGNHASELPCVRALASCSDVALAGCIGLQHLPRTRKDPRRPSKEPSAAPIPLRLAPPMDRSRTVSTRRQQLPPINVPAAAPAGLRRPSAPRVTAGVPNTSPRDACSTLCAPTILYIPHRKHQIEPNVSNISTDADRHFFPCIHHIAGHRILGKSTSSFAN